MSHKNRKLVKKVKVGNMLVNAKCIETQKVNNDKQRKTNFH